MLWTTALAIAVAYLVVVALVVLFQARLVYFPSRDLAATPASAGLPFEEVALAASDGVRLSAWFIPAEKPRGVVLFCHGNAGNISHRIEIAAYLRRMGLSALLFDYRGYGRSEGTPTERGTYLDAEAAWNWLVEQRGVAPRRIVAWGESLGGPIAARLATERRLGALVLQSTFTSLPDLGAQLYPWLPVRLLSRLKYPTLAYVAEARCPVLVLHSPTDEIVPCSHGRRLFDAAKEPKAFVELTGGHNDGFLLSGRPFADALEAFLARHLDAEAPASRP